MDKINDMFMKHADKTELDSIFQIVKIKRMLAEFPFESTYGHDLILPSALKKEEVSDMIISKILEQFKNNYILPKDMLVGRLILLSKTGHP